MTDPNVKFVVKGKVNGRPVSYSCVDQDEVDSAVRAFANGGWTCEVVEVAS